MRFLVDNQLPPALARFLSAKGWVSLHVAELGLDTANDEEIVRFALESQLIIVTKDRDFSRLAAVRGRPQVVLVRLGNCRPLPLLATFDRALHQVTAALAAGRVIVELA